MVKKINKTEVGKIIFDYKMNRLKIFNKKNLLLYDEVTNEKFFKKTVSKFFERKSE